MNNWYRKPAAPFIMLLVVAIMLWIVGFRPNVSPTPPDDIAILLVIIVGGAFVLKRLGY